MSGIMTFCPSPKEFNDFKAYVNFIEAQGAPKGGIAKIIPPSDWSPRKNGYDDIFDIVIEKPICQNAQGTDGVFEHITSAKKSMTVASFKALANSSTFKTPQHQNYDELEQIYWNTINNGIIPLYGADVENSVMDQDVTAWNMNKLETILDDIITDYGKRRIVKGVNTAYLYFGMWKTSFVWHTEDMDLYSINYLHTGSPKTWYSVPPSHGRQFEQLLTKLYKDDAETCNAFFRHKICLVSPEVLRSNGIPFNKIVQKPGEFIITFPFGYHSGFNHGFNLAEATNFATERWIEYGKRVRQCSCRNLNVVKFSMDTFVKRYQNELYKMWRKGLDVGPHPEFPEDISAATKPTSWDVWCNPSNRKRFQNLKPKLARGRPRKKPKIIPCKDLELPESTMDSVNYMDNETK